MEESQKHATKLRTSPRDFFIILLSIVTLYWSAISFLTIVFQLINTWIPDSLDLSMHAIKPALRFGIASLAITFPIYFWSAWYMARDYVLHLEKRTLLMRRWLVYFTLFASALIIIGDAVSLLNNFLSGEMQIRFILKGISILVVAALIFGYYLVDVRKDEKIEKRDHI